MLTRATPLELAKRAIGYIVLMHSALFAPFLLLVLERWRDVPGSHSGHIALGVYDWACIVLVFVPSLAAAWLFSRTMGRLDYGRRKKEWADRDIAVAETWINSPLLKRSRQILPWIIFGGYVIAVFLVRRSPPTDFRITCDAMPFIILLISPKTRLRQLRKRLAPEPRPRPPRQTSAKLHSDFWGVRSVEE